MNVKVFLSIVCLVVCASEAMVFDAEKFQMLQQIVRNSKKLEKSAQVDLIHKMFVHDTVQSGGCMCKNNTCSCCVHLELEEIGLDDKICVEVSYLPKNFGASVALLFNGKVIFRKEISARNPPAICADVPGLKKYASLCLKLSDLDYTSKVVSGCAEIDAMLAGFYLEKFNLGCFRIPISKSGLMMDGNYPLTKM